MVPSTAFAHNGKEHVLSERRSEKTEKQLDILTAAQAKFVQRNPRSLELHLEAIKSLPGGNTRTLLHTAPFPLCMKSGKGYQVTDEDGNT